MRIVRTTDRSYVPAGHEDPVAPGVWKKVLFQKHDLRPGTVQMINWAKLPAGNRFAAHYHEDMQEIFIILRGQVRITVGNNTAELGAGDSVLIDPREIHQMENPTQEDAEYLALGIAGTEHGRTVLAPAPEMP